MATLALSYQCERRLIHATVDVLPVHATDTRREGGLQDTYFLRDPYGYPNLMLSLTWQ